MSDLKLESKYMIDGKVVEFECKFIGYEIYSYESADDCCEYFFVKNRNVSGVIKATSEGSSGEGDYSSVMVDFIKGDKQ